MSPNESVKKWVWNSNETARDEYHDWHMHFITQLSSQGIEYVLSATDTELRRPRDPGPAPDEDAYPEKYSKWFGYAEKHRQATATLQDAFTKAIGLIRSTLPYPSMASSEIEAIMLSPPSGPTTTGTLATTNLIDGTVMVQPSLMWAPENRFRAAYKLITETFSPNDSADVTTLRRTIQDLSDIKCKGFHEYASEFTKLYVILTQANATPSMDECREWIKKGIQNEKMKLALTNYILYSNDSPTYDEMLNHLRKYLRTQGEESDPYKTSFSSPTRPLVAALASTDSKWNGCTRCWRPGHHFSKCTENNCSQCNTLLANQTYCSNWRNHADKRTRWAPRSRNNNSGNFSSPSTPTSNHPSAPQVTPDVKEQIKNTRKALNALIKSAKASKRQKTSDTG